MNKLLIPALLVATVMVAGAFAFMPVQQASTVHTTIGILQSITQSQAEMDAGDEITLTCDGPFEVTSVIVDTMLGGGIDDNGDNVDLLLDVDGAGANWSEDIISNDLLTFATITTGDILDGETISGVADGKVSVQLEADFNDGDDEGLRVQFIVRSTGTCSGGTE